MIFTLSLLGFAAGLRQNASALGSRERPPRGGRAAVEVRLRGDTECQRPWPQKRGPCDTRFVTHAFAKL